MKLSIATLTLLIWIPGFVFSQSAILSNYKVGSQTTASIAGTSSLHDWHCTVESISGTAKITHNQDELIAVNSLNMTFDVNSIKSGKAAMDKNTYKALNLPKFPTINYELTRTNSIEFRDGAYQLSTVGNLTIAGKTQSIQMQVTGTVQANGSLSFSGSKRLNMKTFDVDPPTAVFGTIKTGEMVTVSFHVILNKTTI